MGMHLAHNIRMLKIKSKKIFFASWLSSVKFTFFSMSFAARGRGILLTMPRPCPSSSKLLRSQAYCWCIICFCTSNGSVRILKKARGNIFLKWYYFEEIVKIVSFWKKISSLFQYSDRTVASTETNNTSAESLGSQLFGARWKRAWHGQEGATPTCRKRHWKKKVNLTELSQDAKKIFFDLFFTRNPAPRASKRVRLVAMYIEWPRRSLYISNLRS